MGLALIKMKTPLWYIVGARARKRTRAPISTHKGKNKQDEHNKKCSAKIINIFKYARRHVRSAVRHTQPYVFISKTNKKS